MRPVPSNRSGSMPLPDVRVFQAARDVALAIPAYAPPESLIDLVDALSDCKVPAILLVDDGSPRSSDALFELLASNPRVHLLRHERNRGRGAALKTAMSYFLDHLSHMKGLVTVDAGGEHAVDDVVRVTWSLHRSNGVAIVGSRRFEPMGETGEGQLAPLRSVVGNRVMSALFRWTTGLPLDDAQCGLRGLPSAVLPALRCLPGDRYDFEMAMLMWMAKAQVPLAEQPIRTLYPESARSSNFRPLRDSVGVLRALLMGAYRGAPAGTLDSGRP